MKSSLFPNNLEGDLHASLMRKHRSQDFVAIHHLLQSAAEFRGIEGTIDAQDTRRQESMQVALLQPDTLLLER
jgi:hypothetical protein